MESTNVQTIEGNSVVFEFNTPAPGSNDAPGDFNYQRRSFVPSEWIAEILILSEFEVLSSPLVFDLVKNTLIKRISLEIVSHVRERSKENRLDRVQRLSINGTECLLSDGNEIRLTISDGR